jgi:hypothetical protein
MLTNVARKREFENSYCKSPRDKATHIGAEAKTERSSIRPDENTTVYPRNPQLFRVGRAEPNVQLFLRILKERLGLLTRCKVGFYLGDYSVMRFVVRLVLGTFLAACLSNCGAVVWTETAKGPPRQSVDGAVITYALAQGTLNVQAELKSNELTVTTDQKVIAKADPNNIYSLIYNHSSISEDDINIQMDTGLIKSIATTTTDKTIPIIQGVTSLLTQVAATQSAIEKAARPAVAEPKETPKCADMQSAYVKNITHNTGTTYITKPGTAGCRVVFTVTEVPVSRELFGLVGFPRPDEAQLTPVQICEQTYAFCFRLAGLFKISVSAHVEQGGAKVTPEVSLPPFTVAAPVAGQLGYVHFDRRAFVANKASISFDSAGIVSGFTATNPSEVLGFIALPTAIAAGVAAAVALH